MGITFGGRTCFGPMRTYRECRKHGLPTDWFGLPNCYRCPRGCQYGYGHLLMTRGDIASLDLSKLHDLVLTDHFGGRVTSKDLVFVQSRSLTPGSPRDPSSIHLVEVADRRWFCKNPYWAPPISRHYNVHLVHDNVMSRRTLRWSFKADFAAVNKTNLVNGALTVTIALGAIGEQGFAVTITDTKRSIVEGFVILEGKSSANAGAAPQKELIDCSAGAGTYFSWMDWSVLEKVTAVDFRVLGGSGDETIKVERGTFVTPKLWTWQRMLNDIWRYVGAFDMIASPPQLPKLKGSPLEFDYCLPSEFPHTFLFDLMPAWDAYAIVLKRLACDFAYNPLSPGDSTIVQIGTEDKALVEAQDKYFKARRRLYDADFIEGARARVPKQVLVMHNVTMARTDHLTFWSSENWWEYSWWLDWWINLKDKSANKAFASQAVNNLFWQTLRPYVVRVKEPDTGETKGLHKHLQDRSIKFIWDDLPYVHMKNGTLTEDSTAAVEARAKQRAEDYYRMLNTGGLRMHQIYAGYISDKEFLPGPRISATAWYDRGNGPRTEILHGPPEVAEQNERHYGHRDFLKYQLPFDPINHYGWDVGVSDADISAGLGETLGAGDCNAETTDDGPDGPIDEEPIYDGPGGGEFNLKGVEG